ncbi:imidazole glycerol phosphate synthase subunit HisH [Legionella sp. W05-934-2]|uniref:imidazole glycerol phosphate synthase subunit HisH n=1 Tax=Legionella sp. W05-934-2 TaxID=1198649 RepID=UPI0034628E47
MIVVVDYKMGNIGSIVNMFKKLGEDVTVSDQKKDILQADKLILPGVGAFDTGITHLEKLDLIDVLNEKVLKDKTPILGICIGMQLMAKSSEEGVRKGLSWFDAEVKKFDFQQDDKKLRVPCIGWNMVKPMMKDILFNGEDEFRFYFVHSYYFDTQHSADILAVSTYGFDYPCAVKRENIYGVQFHPEKSHKFGLQMFRNFIQL